MSVYNADKDIRPRPEHLPATISELTRVNKAVPTLNDYVEEIHLRLYDKSSEYRDLLEAVYDEDTVEGSMAADNYFAAKMIRDRAINADPNHYLAHKKAATISKALNVVAKRWGISRKTRRQTVAGEVIPEAANNNPE